jgi:hypothetical protein
VLQLDVLYRLLDELRGEAIRAVESPSEEYRNAFGFGRVAGMLWAVQEMRERIDAKVEEVDQQEELRG